MQVQKTRLFRFSVAAAVLLSILVGTLLAVNRAEAGSLDFSYQGGASPTDLTVQALDAGGAPIAGAQVWATAAGASTDRLATAVDGSVTIPLQGAGAVAAAAVKTVCVNRAGFTALCVSGVRLGRLTATLREFPGSSGRVVAAGTTRGWATPNDSGKLLTGFVVPAITSDALLDFNAQTFISPLTDSIDAFGSHDIPSNLAFPDQTVRVIFASARLNKPNFRLPMAAGAATRLAHLQGVVGVTDLLSLSGGFNFAILNKLRMSRLGFTAPFTVPSRDFSRDVTADRDLVALHSVKVTPAPFNADVLTISLLDVDGNHSVLLPTDLKLAIAARRAATELDRPLDGSPGTSPDGTMAALFAEPGLFPWPEASPPSPGEGENPNLATGTTALVGARAAAGQSNAVLTVALDQAAGRYTGILTLAAGANVASGDYLTAPDAINGARIGAALTLDAPAARSLSLATLGAGPDDARGDYPVARLYALPGARAAFDLRTLLGAGSASPVRELTVSKLEFGSGFDPAAIDGSRQLLDVRRFASAKGSATYAP